MSPVLRAWHSIKSTHSKQVLDGKGPHLSPWQYWANEKNSNGLKGKEDLKIMLSRITQSPKEASVPRSASPTPSGTWRVLQLGA